MSLALAVDAAGNSYCTGKFYDTDFNPGTDTFTLSSAASATLEDIFILKLDGEGNFLWAKSCGGNGVDKGYGIGVDPAGNIYVTGEFDGTVDFDPGPIVHSKELESGYSPKIQIVFISYR